MKSRRWFSGPKLNEWRLQTAVGSCDMPFFMYPYKYRAGFDIILSRHRFYRLHGLDYWIGVDEPLTSTGQYLGIKR